MRARPQVAQMASPTLRCTAFAGHRRIASGELRHVALKAKQARDLGRPVLVFEDASGRQVDLPLELPAAELLRHLVEPLPMPPAAFCQACNAAPSNDMRAAASISSSARS